MSSPETVAALLASLLRGEGERLDALAHDDVQASLLAVAESHGVDCLLRHVLKERGLWPSVPQLLSAGLDARARRESVMEVGRRRELARVVSVLNEAGVDTLVLKGSGLAHTHYPAAYLRPCADVDLMIRSHQIARASDQLEALGYARVNSMSREAVHTQTTFERRQGSLRHVVDLHWAISNRPLFAAMLSFDELAANAVPVAALGCGAATPDACHALLFACIHRIAHHNDSQLLMWLFDIKLLAESLSREQWEQFLELAISKQLVAVCRESLAVTAVLLGGCTEGRCRFEGLPRRSGVAAEPSAAYLGGTGSRLRGLALDLKDSAGFRAKLRLFAGHLFPDPMYMRTAYGAHSRMALANAYARRAAMGVWKTVALPVARTRIAR